MCGPACMDNNWIPSIYPTSRPPKNGGWSITDLPPSLQSLGDEVYNRLVWAWANRQKFGNNDPASAINEQVTLLTLNDVVVNKELKREIRENADREWCSRDPSRCPKKSLPHDPNKSVKVTMRAAVQQGPRRSCCGG